MQTEQSNEAVLKQMMVGAWLTQALAVAAELGVADALAKGEATPRELASSIGAQEEAVRRLLRALCSVGVFVQDEAGRFGLTPMGALLRSESSGALRSLARMSGAEFFTAWQGLHHSVMTGRPGFDWQCGRNFFAYMGENPQRREIYDDAMHAVHGQETGAMLAAYDFGRFSRLVDVGGGNGSTLAGVLEKVPHLRGILYELADAADRARETFRIRGLESRAAAVSGDFFREVPRGGDVYLLRHVLHDWNDDEAAAILQNCRNSMVPGGRVLVVESVLPAGNDFHFVKWLDLMMLLIGGRERTVEEYSLLMERAGLRLHRVVHTTCDVSVLEGVAT